MMKSGSIYFVRCGAAVKIGFTTDLEARLRVLRTDSPEELELMASVEGDRREEARLHRFFRNWHIRGEWYRTERGLLDFIAQLNAPAAAGQQIPPLVFDRAALEALGL